MAISKKFAFSMDNETKDVIRLASEKLGCDMTEIVRIGSYKFACLILEGKFDDIFIEQIKQ